MTTYWNDADIVGSFADSPNLLSAIPPGDPPPPAVVGKCCLYESDELKLEATGAGGVTMHLIRIYAPTTMFGFLDIGAAVTVGTQDLDTGEMVDGIDYTVWKRLMEGDGAITQMLLREVAGE